MREAGMMQAMTSRISLERIVGMRLGLIASRHGLKFQCQGDTVAPTGNIEILTIEGLPLSRVADTVKIG
jgi:hypothetical protein